MVAPVPDGPFFATGDLEFLPKLSKSLFLRKQEFRPFKIFGIPAFAVMAMRGSF